MLQLRLSHCCCFCCCRVSLMSNNSFKLMANWMFMLRDFYGARRVTVIGFLFYFVLLHYANLFQTFFLLLPPQFSLCICVARLSRPLEDVFSWLVSSLNQFSLRKCVLDHLSAAQSSSRWLCYTFFFLLATFLHFSPQRSFDVVSSLIQTIIVHSHVHTQERSEKHTFSIFSRELTRECKNLSRVIRCDLEKFRRRSHISSSHNKCRLYS